jgi:hypothetical protein
MGLYKLTAKKKGCRSVVVRFVAVDDTDATFIGMFKMLDKANAQWKAGLVDGVWVVGEITLSSDDGRVIHTAKSKEKTTSAA